MDVPPTDSNKKSIDLALCVAYYNFLRPHKLHRYKRPLVEDDVIKNGDNMPANRSLEHCPFENHVVRQIDKKSVPQLF